MLEKLFRKKKKHERNKKEIAKTERKEVQAEYSVNSRPPT